MTARRTQETDRRRRKRGEVVTIPWSTAFSAIAVDGRLQLAESAQFELLTLVRIQVLHVSGKEDENWFITMYRPSTVLQELKVISARMP